MTTREEHQCENGHGELNDRNKKSREEERVKRWHHYMVKYERMSHS